MNSFPRWKILFAIAIAFALVAFLGYLHLIASLGMRRMLGVWQVDKVAHFFGGIFIAIIWEWRVPRLAARYGLFLGAFFAITIGWEAFEFFFDPSTKFYYELSPRSWIRDAIGDVVVALVGASVWRAYLSKPKGNPKGADAAS